MNTDPTRIYRINNFDGSEHNKNFYIFMGLFYLLLYYIDTAMSLKHCAVMSFPQLVENQL